MWCDRPRANRRSLTHGWPLRSIDGVAAAFSTCYEEGTLLHETGLAPWAKPATSMHINGYHHFAGPASVQATVEAATFVPRSRTQVMPA